MTDERTIAEQPQGIIKLMPPELANKIAAGEVVQRPASVVKELLDNALDAGANAIEIEVSNAGKTYIRVTDNGSGMTKSDLQMSVVAHATSKISDIDDLFAIRSLGFRGEAMASIASISHITIATKMHGENKGWQLHVEGGLGKPLEPIACANGTSVQVKNLFFNVPARRAFLKTNQTEFRHILTVFQNAALANPDIAFHLMSEGQTYIDLPSASLEKRITDIFGKDYKASLIPVELDTEWLKIGGFIIDPLLSKKTRGEQFFFVNGRPFQHRYLVRSVLEEYEPWIKNDDYPFAALFFEINPSKVDVNVHPTKLEVKFDDDRGLITLTRSVIRKALGERFSVPEMNAFEKSEREQNPFDASLFRPGNHTYQMPSRINERPSPAQIQRGTENVYGFSQQSKKEDSFAPLFSQGGSANQVVENESIKGSTGFTQIHGRYIISQTRTGFCVIDQQAAHRRIIFERVMMSAEGSLAATQQLLFPKTLEFSASDYELLSELHPIIESIGFSIQLLSGKSAVLSGVPAELHSGDENQLIFDILRNFQDLGEQFAADPRKKLAMAIARKLSVRPRKALTPVEMEHLVDQLFSCEKPYVDPQNRPTIIYISLEELASRFR